MQKCRKLIANRLMSAALGVVEPTEVGIGVMHCIWGLYMVNPVILSQLPEFWDIYPRYFNPCVFGVLSLAISSFTWVAFLKMGINIRRVAMMLSFVFWLYLVAGFIASGFIYPSVTFFVYFMLTSGWAFIRLSLRKKVKV